MKLGLLGTLGLRQVQNLAQGVLFAGPVFFTLTYQVLHPTLPYRGVTPYTLHPTPYTLHLELYTPHPTPYTLHPTPYTLHPALFTLYPPLYTQHQSTPVLFAGPVFFTLTYQVPNPTLPYPALRYPT